MNKLGKTLKILLIVMTIIFIPLVIMTPHLLAHNKSIIYTSIVVYPNGILMLAVIYQFIKLFKSLEQNKPFTLENVKILKTTSILSLVMSILWILDLLFILIVVKNTYINYIIVLLFLSLLFFGVFIALYILSELFRQATNYKEENDLTI